MRTTWEISDGNNFDIDFCKRFKYMEEETGKQNLSVVNIGSICIDSDWGVRF